MLFSLSNKPFPNHLIEAGTYKCIPNQREEIKAERNEYTRELYRITAPGMKTKIQFTTVDLNLDMLEMLQDFINSIMIDESQRKVGIKYWDFEKSNYGTGYFYISDIEYVVDESDEYDILIQPITINLVEY